MSAAQRSVSRFVRPFLGLVYTLALGACQPEATERGSGLDSAGRTGAEAAPLTAGGRATLVPAVAPPLQSSAAARAARWTDVGTLRTGSGFAVLVGGVQRGEVVNQEISNSVAVTADPEGTYAAVIPDYDGTLGTALIVMQAGEAPRTLVRTGVTSAAFSADGSRLAYVTAAKGEFVLHVGTPSSPGAAVARLAGTEATVLGWQDDGRAIFVQSNPAGQEDVVETVPNVFRVDAASGEQTRVLASDPARHLVYRDVRLVSMNGSQYLSAIRASSAFPCGDGPSDILLARLDGSIAHRFGQTSDTYREAIWSDDGSQIAFTAQACVSQKEKTAGSAASRASEVAGTYLASTATGGAKQLIRGISAYRLSGLHDGNLHLTSDRFGSRVLIAGDDGAPVQALTLEPETHAPASVNNRAVFINQVYDTRDAFDGRGSCGPTSCIMNLADYQLAPNGLWVDFGGRHWSDYGLYITDSYSYLGITFSKTEVDFSGRGAWAGAHGHMFKFGVGSYWSEIKSFLDSHTGWAKRVDTWDPVVARDELAKGRLLVAGGTFRTFKHIVLIKGYTAGGDWIVHDPYGVRTSGGPGGADQIYRIGTDMTITRFVSN